MEIEREGGREREREGRREREGGRERGREKQDGRREVVECARGREGESVIKGKKNTHE